MAPKDLSARAAFRPQEVKKTKHTRASQSPPTSTREPGLGAPDLKDVIAKVSRDFRTSWQNADLLFRQKYRGPEKESSLPEGPEGMNSEPGEWGLQVKQDLVRTRRNEMYCVPC